MPGTDDSGIATCKWFVNGAVKTESFPAKALENKSKDPHDMSDEELESIIANGKRPIVGNTEETGLEVGDTVSLKRGGPLMTIVSIGNSPSLGRG